MLWPPVPPLVPPTLRLPLPFPPLLTLLLLPLRPLAMQRLLTMKCPLASSLLSKDTAANDLKRIGKLFSLAEPITMSCMSQMKTLQTENGAYKRSNTQRQVRCQGGRALESITGMRWMDFSYAEQLAVVTTRTTGNDTLQVNADTTRFEMSGTFVQHLHLAKSQHSMTMIPTMMTTSVLANLHCFLTLPTTARQCTLPALTCSAFTVGKNRMIKAFGSRITVMTSHTIVLGSRAS